MVSRNFRNEVLRISVSDTKHLLSGSVSLFSEAGQFASIWWGFRPLKFLQSCPQLHDTPLVSAEVLVGLSCFVQVLIPDLVIQLRILSPFRAASLFFLPLAIKMLMKKWLARPQLHFQSILDVNCKRKMQCLLILECSEANGKNCKISGNLGDLWSTMKRNP